MAEICKGGTELVAEVTASNPQRGSLAFWWLGQNGFALRGAGATIYIDPYLKNDPRRATPVPVSPSEIDNADLILGTHDHGDHIDRSSLPAMMEASPRSVLVVSRVAAHRLVAEGYPPDRVRGLDHEQSLDAGPVSITAIRAAHEFFDRDPALGYPHLSFVIKVNGVTLYHAGDGVPWDGLAATVRAHQPGIVCVPINGRDAERYRRNCLGNFTFQEAVDFCGAVEPRLAVPMHYDMFPGNQERVERFVDYLEAKYPGTPCWVGKVGERVVTGPW